MVAKPLKKISEAYRGQHYRATALENSVAPQKIEYKPPN